MSLHTDVHRDRIIGDYKPRSFEDLKAFTDFMLMASDMLCHAEPPKVIEVSQEWDRFESITEFVKYHFKITNENFHLIDRMIHWPVYGDYDRDEILEKQCSKYAEYREPVLQALYREYCLPRVYEWLAHEWTVRPLRELCGLLWLYVLGSELMKILHSWDWPDTYLSKLECSICFESIYIRKWKTVCMHTFHPDCIYEWIKDHDTCPNCRMPNIC